MRPAVNVGLSVSRVGGAAQTKAMKKAAGSIRIDLAQFREMEVFTQFASDLDNATKEQLQHGHVLMELLKQPLCRPLSMAEQVMTLCAANGRVMLDVPVDHVKDFQMQFLSYMKEQHSDIVRQLETTKALDDELNKQICDAAEEFKKEFLQNCGRDHIHGIGDLHSILNAFHTTLYFSRICHVNLLYYYHCLQILFLQKFLLTSFVS